MRYVLAIIFFILFMINLVYEVFFVKFNTGWEAILVIGLTFGGVYLTWTVITDGFKK